jgi:hypothetical protein
MQKKSRGAFARLYKRLYICSRYEDRLSDPKEHAGEVAKPQKAHSHRSKAAFEAQAPQGYQEAECLRTALD